MREFSIYILEDVVAAAVVCGMCGRYWTTRTCALEESLQCSCHPHIGICWHSRLHQCSKTRGVAGLQNECVVKVYIGQFGRHVAFTLHCVGVSESVKLT